MNDLTRSCQHIMELLLDSTRGYATHPFVSNIFIFMLEVVAIAFFPFLLRQDSLIFLIFFYFPVPNLAKGVEMFIINVIFAALY